MGEQPQASGTTLKYNKNMARLGKVEGSSPLGARKCTYIYNDGFWLILIPVRRVLRAVGS